MLLLIVSRIYLHQSGRLCATSESGVHYWGAIYIPVVVAMAMMRFLMVGAPRLGVWFSAST